MRLRMKEKEIENLKENINNLMLEIKNGDKNATKI